MKLIALASTLFFAACGNSPRDNPEPVVDLSIKPETAVKLHELRNSTYSWSKTCKGIACKEGPTGDGDSLLWAGLLCLSGEQSQCNAASRSQDSDGRLWRSPDRVGVEDVNTSSRDMLSGFLAYLAKTKDTASASALLIYIQNNDQLLCPDSTDTRCLMLPASYGLMSEIWKSLGLEPSPNMKIAESGAESLLVANAKEAPSGYQMHLQGVNVFIRQYLGKNSNKTLEAAKALSSREPTNPFFLYLVQGRSEAVAAQVLNKCPMSTPGFLNQWSWERSMEQKPWVDSMGWECIFMVNLLVGP